MSPTHHRAALVVGAGPVGLCCALALRARGVEVTVLEGEFEARVRPGSRAIYIHRTSLELLERMRPGLGYELARHGVVWSARRTFWRGREVFARSYPAPSAEVLPPFTSLPQSEIEIELLLACKAAGVELAWTNLAQEIAIGPDRVEVTTSAGKRWSAERLVGADGARSTIRREIGVSLEGDRSENAYVIVDVEHDPGDPRPIERLFHYEHPAVDRRNVLIVPFAGGWRIDLQCRRDDDTELLDRGEALRSWVAKAMGEAYAERIRWVSTYRFLQLVARAFTDDSRRVILAGEAAHLFAPFGARGLNSGIADAHAAAAAISAAGNPSDPEAGKAAIERFAKERHEAATWNRWAAGEALAAMQARGPWRQARRRMAVALAPRVERAAVWLDSAPYGPRLRDSRAAHY